MIELHQIYYKDEQRQKLYPFSIPYFNAGLSIFFENDCISKIVKASSAEKIAVCSWKLAEKLTHRRKLTQEALNSDYQVLSFTRNSGRHQMLKMASVWHPEFMTTISLLWSKLGLKMPNDAKHPIYQNHFAAKMEVYRDYVDNFLDPAMKLINEDEELHQKMMIPSNYERLGRNADVRSVKEKLGVNYYPICPFVLERCPSLWFTMKQIQVTYL